MSCKKVKWWCDKDVEILTNWGNSRRLCEDCSTEKPSERWTGCYRLSDQGCEGRMLWREDQQ